MSGGFLSWMIVIFGVASVDYFVYEIEERVCPKSGKPILDEMNGTHHGLDRLLRLAKYEAQWFTAERNSYKCLEKKAQLYLSSFALLWSSTVAYRGACGVAEGLFVSASVAVGAAWAQWWSAQRGVLTRSANEWKALVAKIEDSLEDAERRERKEEEKTVIEEMRKRRDEIANKLEMNRELR